MWNRQRVINYWLAMVEYHSENGNDAAAEQAWDNAVWCENANVKKFNKRCRVWYRQDQQYWASLPRQQALIA